ncbi:MAG: 16S rRNA (guanine(966)-N(2))-methyltransferase RsmD [Gemmatimonadota bacterium]|nr:16S rRNA (guanine(966)-N(2))-methyltransferase RsmD [Gemmatimonadota bacterium]
MRIVAGRWRGRRIGVPAGLDIRPTADRVREAWMSIIQHDIPGARVLDLFAGTGALGIEALSRGAEHADFVEQSTASIDVLRKNLETVGAGAAASVHRADALKFIERLAAATYEITFADPPYRQGLATALVERWLSTPFSRILGVEHESTEQLPPGGEVRRYGSTAISFYRREGAPQSG